MRSAYLRNQQSECIFSNPIIIKLQVTSGLQLRLKISSNAVRGIVKQILLFVMDKSIYSYYRKNLT